MNTIGGRVLEGRVKPSPLGPACPSPPPSMRALHQRTSFSFQHKPQLQGCRPALTSTNAASPKVMFLGLDPKQAARDGITLPLQHVEVSPQVE
eukprot:scaffold111820_cov18-Tisochrysis_lutea.AAC.1